ncbi:hypothetical protein GIB64_02445 [Pseudomonas lactis]|uniref:hypothetical protein n=1 Tax=Pseudomonas TaxID=286 RepID=UPI000BB6028D|nr:MULTISPECIES: hypothetical protein [Pseudomonas]MBA5956278.1 hypothetical protein [Pseudomonas lactis]PRW80127.1 hypothetical protein C7A12_02840 [Pseudomonas fluorescens]PRW80902.1 hypothetical protein C7A13_06715 [Pseudomonas fluorescens]
MTYEVIVEGYVLQVEVTSCDDVPPSGIANGSRELTFNVLSGTMYDVDRIPMDVCQMELAVIAESKEYVPMIEKALWFEIDARKRRLGRKAA